MFFKIIGTIALKITWKPYTCVYDSFNCYKKYKKSDLNLKNPIFLIF